MNLQKVLLYSFLLLCIQQSKIYSCCTSKSTEIKTMQVAPLKQYSAINHVLFGTQNPQQPSILKQRAAISYVLFGTQNPQQPSVSCHRLPDTNTELFDATHALMTSATRDKETIFREYCISGDNILMTYYRTNL